MGISRNGNSFIARIYRGGKEQNESFAFSKFGGEQGAKEAAERFLKSMETLAPVTPRKKGKKNVYKTHSTNGSGYPVACFKVMWREDGEQHARTFTFQEGDDQSERDAKKRADAFAGSE
jgi:hypothetical protein